ncbi:hypothetical protein MTR67_048283 [Solanum verrucosum]|uniref:Uncharacterized protein n=1 Tax=Solanum verrucosum TaxID=315347 RepID=A0AAF0V1B5_SOLVR|nr:hypothetical protein MTR67_048281 [Solanum verrucosum]WMV54898.1 hypothetical protein MTR67_048283 [Solanum verrucosum]
MIERVTSFLKAYVIKWPNLAEPGEVLLSWTNGCIGQVGSIERSLRSPKALNDSLKVLLDRHLSAPLKLKINCNFRRANPCLSNAVGDSPKGIPFADKPNFSEILEPILSTR